MNTEEKAKVVAADWRTELIQFFAPLAIFHQDYVKKRMNKITATWRNGWHGKMDVHASFMYVTQRIAKTFAFSSVFVLFYAS